MKFSLSKVFLFCLTFYLVQSISQTSEARELPPQASYSSLLPGEVCCAPPPPPSREQSGSGSTGIIGGHESTPEGYREKYCPKTFMPTCYHPQKLHKGGASYDQKGCDTSRYFCQVPVAKGRPTLNELVPEYLAEGRNKGGSSSSSGGGTQKAALCPKPFKPTCYHPQKLHESGATGIKNGCEVITYLCQVPVGKGRPTLNGLVPEHLAEGRNKGGPKASEKVIQNNSRVLQNLKR
jgi:hypothetical protein